MSKQRTRKFVTKILRKTCSSLVKIISDGENNYTIGCFVFSSVFRGGGACGVAKINYKQF